METDTACLEAAFGTLQLPSVVATVYPENTRCIAVLEKLRMQLDSTVFGVWPNSLALLYRVTREAWLRQISAD